MIYGQFACTKSICTKYVIIYKTDTYFNFNFILPKVNTDYIRQAQVLNIDNLLLIITGSLILIFLFFRLSNKYCNKPSTALHIF